MTRGSFTINENSCSLDQYEPPIHVIGTLLDDLGLIDVYLDRFGWTEIHWDEHLNKEYGDGWDESGDHLDELSDAILG